ncbi:glycosyltransferase [Curtobacterium sp. VKM Ac-2884]|uniref:glycosyltransferase n=1 Tax=Curtobacterium sp. VKM Ac-2884 TaxID=2783818 RepID=UPI00188AB4FA|nr:glycosyltransferase [Curtobacterium sp. VKM Ac-2884]MBF4603152.1 glycosyltransferase [Curtobacterium sp. VKM Ac-2884]
MTPTVSVVIPTVWLNEHFQQALESILTQTLRDIEIVVVLDGIADIDHVIPDDSRITVVQHAVRRGTPAALNSGVAAAQAPFIARLDADDVASPERLERQVAEFRSRPDLVLLGSYAAVIDSSGTPTGLVEVPTAAIPAALLRRNAFVHSSVMIRRGALELVGGYDERCNRMQDYDLWLRIARVGQIANIPDVLVAYRVHDGMHSRVTSPIGPAARCVLASRSRLARSLGRSAASQHAENMLWTVAQLLRHARLRRPRYLTAR